ncbi:MAG: hypothetical protein SGPRY_000848 [Prymnesium sp.]
MQSPEVRLPGGESKLPDIPVRRRGNRQRPWGMCQQHDVPSVRDWDSAVRISERKIPVYDALHDPNCEYTKTATFRKHYNGLLQMQAQYPRGPRDGVLRSSHFRLEAAEQSWMPSIELMALKAIDNREDALVKLYELLRDGASILDARMIEKFRHDLSAALATLRMAGVVVCETICRWRKRRGNAEAFVWRSHNYLLKMLVDVFFAGLADSVSEASFDPFQLKCFQPTFSISPNKKKNAESSSLSDSGHCTLLVFWRFEL